MEQISIRGIYFQKILSDIENNKIQKPINPIINKLSYIYENVLQNNLIKNIVLIIKTLKNIILIFKIFSK